MWSYKMNWIHFFLLCILTKVSSHLLLKKRDITVLIGREVYLKPDDLQFQNTSYDLACKVEVVSNEPMTQQVGILEPQVFDCAFNYGTVKYIHHGSPLLSNDTVKLRAYKFLKQDTISEYFELLFLVENSSYDVIQPLLPLVVKEFFGLTDPIDETIINFNYSRKEGAICKVRMSRHIALKPAHGQIIIGREKRSVDIIKRRCDDFLQLGLRYEHLKPPSPNIDFILIIVEVSDPYLNGGDLISEWYHIPVIIEPGFPNLPPKASFSGMYLMDVDQFIITAITPAVLSATDSETPSDQLIFNISKPLLSHQGSIVHLSDHTQPIFSFSQRDLNNFDIAYKPPARSFKERQMFEIGFVICDPDFAYSEPFTMHIAIRPAITSAPRVSMNVGMVLLEGQSRPLRTDNLEVVDSDNINEVQIFITGGLHHGKVEVDNRPAVSFTQEDIISGTVIYHHDDSDSTRDSIHLRIYDGSHSTHTKFPITIIPKDDNPPSLIVNVGLKVSEGGDVQITPSSLRAVDHDTSDEYVNFNLIKPPICGKIWKKFAWEKTGHDVYTFTQRDVNKGLVYYHHDGSEIFSDVFEVILQDVNNPPNVSPNYKISVRIMPVGDDPPKRDPASLFSLEVHETDIGILGTHHLRYMDVDSQDNEIVYTITTLPRFIGSFAHPDPGRIVLLTDESVFNKDFNFTSSETFTQEQINHHKIAYVPPVEEIGPNPLYLQFIFSVKDKDSNIVPGQVFNITILPVNNQIPQLHTGELLVEEGSSTLLSTNELSIYDPDTLTTDLQMSLFTVPLHGSLRRSEQPLRVGDLLSLDDILTLRLEYVHDGSESFKDGFKVGVNDGLHFVSGVVRVSVEPVDDETPVWKKDLLPQISINEGGNVKLTSQVLAASDVDTEDSSLFFILTESPQYGNILLDKRKVNRFTQQDITSGEVIYMHNGQEIGPNPKEDSLTFIVTDKAFPRLMPHDSHKVFITILPQNTRPPRLYFKQAILVEEGQRSTVTEDNISATDDDTFPAELLIVISKQPEHGYLENLRPTPGYQKSNEGKRISAFPLQDVRNGFITFVQFNHSNIEPESDGFEIFVTDGVHNSTSVLVYVSIVLLNDEVPSFYLSNITVDEGNGFIMDNNSIRASDRDYPGDILIISVHIKPKHGALTYFVQAINNGPLLEIPFSQLSLENFESIVYRHDDSEHFEDSFILSLNDGLHNVLRTCLVEINPVNDEPPILLKNIAAKFVELQGNFVLSSAVLLSNDVDSSDDEIFYKVLIPPQHGILERKNTFGNWTLLTPLEFSQDDVNLNRIRYHQTEPPTAYEDGFSFLVSDGLHDTLSAMFTIKLVDVGKTNFTVTNIGAVVKHGGEILLNSSMLFATDSSSNLEDIVFHVTRSPTYGMLVLTDRDSTLLKNFTVFHILNNQLYYKHNESAKVTSDSFNLMATNGVIVKNITFNITILSIINKVPVLEVVFPLSVDFYDSNSYIITSEHLLSYQPSMTNAEIIYEMTEMPKFGSLMYGGKISNPKNYSQEDINRRLISYVPFSNTSVIDQFSFKVSNKEEDGYLLDGKLTLKPTVFQITVRTATQAAEPILLISPPSNLENVWNNHMGFHVNSYNLKATFPGSSPSNVKFYVSKYLQHSFIFNTQLESVVRSFTQEDINDQFIVILLKQEPKTYDYFTFHVAVSQITYKKEYRMDFQWAAVFFPFPEYSVCEDSGALNIAIHRIGNLDVSSYVTITAIEQTAKEGLDFISRRVNKIQFDPGITETVWKIVIVHDDLEEAPIEQMQVILSDPENCILSYQNRTIVSIYDTNRGSCSQIPAFNPQSHRNGLNIFSKTADNANNDNDEISDDREDGEESIIGFPMACNQNIYGLLHYKEATQNLFQCDGKKWVPWVPSISSDTVDLDSLPSQVVVDGKTTQNSYSKSTTTETLSEASESTSESPEVENCPKGWQEYVGKCHKWYRQPSKWSVAKSICETYPSGQLVLVESLEHNNWLLQLARGKPYWIGLHAKLETNEWIYDHLIDAPFLNWKKGFPRLPLNGEVKHRCVLVRGSGLWINKNCESHDHSFICTIPLNVMP